MSDESECVFVKHRNILKFENFQTNHPAIYLPFVIYNWLALAILPNVYSEEEKHFENSRKELLQNNNYLFKVINVVINCILGINIELNHDLFKQNVQQLKEIKTFSKNEILPFVTIESYMSEEDSILFINTFSKFFPQNAVKKSTDAIPCYVFYKTIGLNGTTIWGSPYWVVLHFTTLVVDKMSPSKLKESYQETLCILTGFLDLLLPCALCRYHYTSLYKFNEEEDFERPFQLTLLFDSLFYAKNNNLFEFYSLLHDNCKYMDKRERLGVEYHKKQYEKFYKFKDL